MRRQTSIQRVHINLATIEERVVRLAGGQYRAVLEVSSVNFGLAGEVEREAIIASYAAFLNSLTFPMQVLTRVLPIDLEGPVAELERQAQGGLAEPLAALARDHASFLRRLARQRTLLERRFYLVVPAQAEGYRPPRLPFKRHAGDLDQTGAYRQLTFRCEEVERQLSRCGLTVRRLGDVELAQMFYACWCPDLARVQRLRRHLDEYTVLVTQGVARSGRRS
jgi:hypothetical protein